MLEHRRPLGGGPGRVDRCQVHLSDVAHRPALIDRADRVFEMRSGRLTEITPPRQSDVAPATAVA